MKYTVSRSIEIEKPLKEIFPLVSDFKHWAKWSPWTVLEPNHKVEFGGHAGEAGSTMQWDGKTIGSGMMQIETLTDKKIEYDLQFFKPFKSSAKSAFLLEEKENTTKVTWTMDSSMPFYLFFMVGMMKSWVEMDYDRGLKMLKAIAEDGEIKAKSVNEGVVDFEGFGYIGLKRTAHMDDMPTEMTRCFEKLMQDVGPNAKHWISIYPKVNMTKKLFTFISGASSESLTKDLGNEYIKGTIKSGKMLKITHYGSYQYLGNAWSMGMYQKIKKAGPPFEYYRNSPHDTKEEDLITDIYFPVK